MTTNEAEAVEVRCPDCDAVLSPYPYLPDVFFPCLSKQCADDDAPVTLRSMRLEARS